METKSCFTQLRQSPQLQLSVTLALACSSRRCNDALRPCGAQAQAAASPGGKQNEARYNRAFITGHEGKVQGSSEGLCWEFGDGEVNDNEHGSACEGGGVSGGNSSRASPSVHSGSQSRSASRSVSRSASRPVSLSGSATRSRSRRSVSRSRVPEGDFGGGSGGVGPSLPLFAPVSGGAGVPVSLDVLSTLLRPQPQHHQRHNQQQQQHHQWQQQQGEREKTCSVM